jgi:two-component system, sensor histidine kinase and response regulator
VDDDRMNLRILEGILRNAGYTLATAASGEEALEAYTAAPPDLVLLDVLLPGINGFDTCRELRRRHGAAAAPVIFITAKSESDDVVEGLSAGGVDYLPKPFRPREALARIRTHLQNRLLLEQVTRANEAKNRFLGMAAHDLRNPLASIRGLAEFLLDPMLGELNAEQRDLAATIQTTSQSMLGLVNELLDVATIEAGELRLQRTPTALAEVLAKAVALAQMEGGRKGTRIEFTPPAGELPSVSIDVAKIRQVIDNLLSNAIKYSPPGSLVRVDLAAAEAGRQCFTVTDQGPGIPEGEHDKLFKDFGRLSVLPTGGEKSTGLGLAICRKIVDAHQGQITAQNLPAGGCAFTVTLPSSASPP